MKIAIDARIINSSTGRYVERLLTYLEKIDDKNDYIILLRRKDMSLYTPKNPRFSVVEADFADYSFAEQIGFVRLLYKLRVDLVHFCMPQQPLLYTGISVTTIHDLNLLRITSNDDMGWLELRIKKFIFRMLLHRVAKRAKHIITPSNFTKNDLINFSHIPSEKITVTYEGADPATAEPKPIAKLQNKQFLLYVGRAEPYKNNRGLIKAHQKLLRNHPHLQLAIVGKKDILRKADETWVEQNGYKNIQFLGFVSDAELAWLYSHCKAYIFPSFMEGFGLPGLEAMAYGAAVVSSKSTSLPEVYKDGALYFDPQNTDEMAKCIEQAITDETLRKTLILRGKKIHASYSWERMAKQTLSIYSTALEQK